MSSGVAAVGDVLVRLGELVLPSIVAVLAVWLTHRFALRQGGAERRRDLLSEQINELYSPLVSARQRIRAASELREELGRHANSAWQKICEEAPRPFVDHAKHFEPFRALIEYDNQQFDRELLPLYENMLSIFTKGYWLANESTRAHYKALTRFVELWRRWKAGSLPIEVLLLTEHSEENLYPLYADIESTLAALREEMQR